MIDIADLDVIFLTYDEPKKELFWVECKQRIPWAIRIDGVKGSDAAHKAAAEASTTERFVIIDGDNIPDIDFKDVRLDLSKFSNDAVLRWRAYNHVNGLIYGNGGISCWTKEFVRKMRTHENSDGRAETALEFCFEPNYHAMHNIYSITYTNQTPKQAWRAGFREGVKLATDRGRRIDHETFVKWLDANPQHPNILRLEQWCRVGADVENGVWGCNGARDGLNLALFHTDWDITDVRDFDILDKLWHQTSRPHINGRPTRLENAWPSDWTVLDAVTSAFVKKGQRQFHLNFSPVLTEMEYRSGDIK